jgi:glycosyltransferase involved in cell wall biosynthesis
MRRKLTVIVPCKNESQNILACVCSIALIADEILIADSGSTDDTIELAQQVADCRVISREYRTSGDFKNWAIPQASDERITCKLADEINSILSSEKPRDGYWIYRQNHFMGHPIRHGGWNHDRVLRLFRRDLGRYQGPSDHGEVYVSTNQVGVIRNRMLHYSYWDYDQLFRKFHRYTTLQAEQWAESGRQTNGWQLFYRPVLRFLRDYFLLLGILDGRVGIQLSMMAAFYTFTKQARLWALNNGKDQASTERSYRNVIAGFARYEELLAKDFEDSIGDLDIPANCAA